MKILWLASLVLTSLDASASQTILSALIKESPLFLIGNESNSKDCPSRLDVEMGRVWSDRLKGYHDQGIRIRSERNREAFSIIDVGFDREMINGPKVVSKRYDRENDVVIWSSTRVTASESGLSFQRELRTRDGVDGLFSGFVPFLNPLKAEQQLTIQKLDSKFKVELNGKDSAKKRKLECTFGR